MKDSVVNALIRPAHIAVHLAFTLNTCKEAQQVQKLQSSSALALGRLITSCALMAKSALQPSALSLQIVCEGRLGQVFADITETGDVRGYVKHHDLNLPMKHATLRRSISPLIGKGQLSIIRLGQHLQFAQSTTDLQTSEIDTDVEYFLQTSDQVPTLLNCEVLFDDQENMVGAGGVMIQCLPNANLAEFTLLQQHFLDRPFAERLKECWNGDSLQNVTQKLLHEIHSQTEIVSPFEPVQWRCRCSTERVLTALKMLTPTDLADMIDKKEPAIVHCEFCTKRYEISTETVEKVFLQTVTGKN